MTTTKIRTTVRNREQRYKKEVYYNRDTRTKA